MNPEYDEYTGLKFPITREDLDRRFTVIGRAYQEMKECLLRAMNQVICDIVKNSRPDPATYALGASKIPRESMIALRYSMKILDESRWQNGKKPKFVILPALFADAQREIRDPSGIWSKWFTIYTHCYDRCGSLKPLGYARRGECDGCLTRAMRRWAVDLSLLLAPLQLPAFVLLWIIEYLPRFNPLAIAGQDGARSWNALVRLRIIERVAVAWNNRKSARCK